MIRKKMTLSLLACTFALAAVTQVQAAAPAVVESRDHGVAYLHAQLAKNDYKYVMDWPALAAYSAGESVTSKAWTTAEGQNGVTWRERDVLKHVGISDATTDFERGVIGLLAAKQNPRAFGRKDFIQAILDAQLPNGKFADTVYGYGEELLNPHIYGIMALYAAGMEIPRADLAKEYLLSKQRPDGGFNWANGDTASNPDVTAAALIAMKVLGMAQTDGAVQKALTYLKSVQTEQGGFSNLGTVNPDSAAMVIQALQMYDIDPVTWKKGAHDPLSFVLGYQGADGSFSYTKGGTPNFLATQNAVLALSDLAAGKSVYERLHEENKSRQTAWQPAFKDLPFSHPYYSENTKLVNLGVMNGFPEGTYRPNESITREQFAKVIVYGAIPHHKDEVGEKITVFRDLAADRWSNPFVQVAYTNKYLKGTSPTTFDPAGQVTGAQLMTILVRMLGREEDALAVKGQVLWYDGYVKVAQEDDLWYPGFDPDEPATRAEVGYSFVRYYDKLIEQANR